MDEAFPERDSRAERDAAEAELALAGVLAGGGGRSYSGRPSALRFQFRVLRALILRDIAGRNSQSRLGPLLAILLPILSLTVLMVAFSLRGKTIPSDFSLGVFVVTGYPLWQGFQGMYTKVMGAATRSDPLLMFPQITQLDLIFATILLDTAINTVVFICMAVGVTIVFQDTPPDDPVGVLLCFWSTSWLGSAFGLVLCGLNRVAPTLVTVLNTFMRFGMWLSGVIFAVSKLPPWTWPYLKWNPILHCTEGARHLWKSSFEAPIFDPLYIVGSGFVLTTLGFVLERLTRRFVGP
jgi:capsular polysaccharide transport system permease protein